MARSWIGLGSLLLVAMARAQQPVAPVLEPVPAPAAPQVMTREPVNQQPSSQQMGESITTIRAHARAVVVDVVVTDGHGHSVHGLKMQDFTVQEDGSGQKISNFDEVVPKANAAELIANLPKLPPNTFTNANKAQGTQSASTVLLLDALDTSPQAQSYAREQLIKYVETAKITGPIAIFSLDTQLHLVQGFTTDINVLRAAVKERAKLLLSPIPLNGKTVSQQIRLDGLTAAMQSLSQYLAAFPGRKNLIWMTGSIPMVSPQGDEPGIGPPGSALSTALIDPAAFSFDYADTTDKLSLGRVAVYPIDVTGLLTLQPVSASTSFGKVSTKPDVVANKAIGQGIKHENMVDVANATGGKAFYDNNGIKEAIEEVVDTGSDYYTITYYPTNKDWNNKYRKLKVTLDRPGDKLEYRRGYFAMAEEGDPAYEPPPVPNPSTIVARRQITEHEAGGFWDSMQLGAIDPGSIVFTAHVTPGTEVTTLPKGAALPKNNFLEPKFRDKPFREYVVDYAVGGKQLEMTPSGTGTLTGQIEFALAVLDDKGVLVNTYQATVNMNLKPETYAYVLKNGVTYPAKIAIPVKGNYFIRAGVHDVPSGKAGALELNVGEVKMEAAKP